MQKINPSLKIKITVTILEAWVEQKSQDANGKLQEENVSEPNLPTPLHLRSITNQFELPPSTSSGVSAPQMSFPFPYTSLE